MSKSRLLFTLAIIFGINAALITFWKTTWSAHLLDYAYHAEISYRIFSGQVPYRDFMLVLTPGVYAISAAIMRLTGGYSHGWLVVHAVTVAFFTSVVCFFVFHRLAKNTWLAMLLSISILPVGPGIYPYPDYSNWSAFIVMVGILLITFFPKTTHPGWLGFVIGLVSAISFLFKQNVGLPFAGLVLFSFGVKWLLSRSAKERIGLLFVALGEGVIFLGFLCWLVSQHTVVQFLYQTFTFPKSVREPGKNLSNMIIDYQTTIPLLIPVFSAFVIVFCILMALKRFKGNHTVPWVHKGLIIISGVVSIAGVITVLRLVPDSIDLLITLIWVLGMILGGTVMLIEGVYAFINRRVSLLLFLPGIILLTLQSGFITTSIAWSSFPLWPLLYAILAWSYPTLKRIYGGFPILVFISIGFIVPIYAMGGYLYTDAYAHFAILYTKGPIVRSSKEPISGLSNPGPWIGAFEHLLEDTEKRIPKTDTVAFLPGDDVFLAASRRENVMRCSQWNIGTCDVFGDRLIEEIRNKNIDWIIIKDPTMFPNAYGIPTYINIPAVPIVMTYTLEAEIDGIYKIYKRPTVIPVTR